MKLNKKIALIGCLVLFPFMGHASQNDSNVTDLTVALGIPVTIAGIMMAGGSFLAPLGVLHAITCNQLEIIQYKRSNRDVPVKLTAFNKYLQQHDNHPIIKYASPILAFSSWVIAPAAMGISMGCCNKFKINEMTGIAFSMSSSGLGLVAANKIMNLEKHSKQVIADAKKAGDLALKNNQKEIADLKALNKTLCTKVDRNIERQREALEEQYFIKACEMDNQKIEDFNRRSAQIENMQDALKRNGSL